MKANVGGIDKILRIVAGVVLLALAIMGIGAPWTFIGIVPLATGLMGWCPLYPLLGLSTCPVKKN
ncbi:YgaP family membrane protein [Parazoarcus communis]|uniref:DUF2892 domain-containing protein n=1 Tax=Parazoarcus communis SWub3 = DSM 12120 TaxID=1121029 RepID=A0A323UWH9_9RHOO|nr:DUF2892 domain-containing protein [Parazoarcus communis]NMG68921.1 DUF2892 domain-containing protein [Parazoarcus communis SWub3 = DSM 12120]PZA16795.1 DUF2892 domain-containing protein [Azoarcus communis] [Parazoarcus communis SWub3 = DSM 12120]